MTAKVFGAKLVSILEEVKTKSNGKQYLTATVEFTDGPLVGKTYFAQRTLGENKSAIAVGQNVRAILEIVERDGVKRPFFEISTSIVDDADSLMALLGQ